MLEYYGPTIKYIKETSNDTEDALRRLPFINSELTYSEITR